MIQLTECSTIEINMPLYIVLPNITSLLISVCVEKEINICILNCLFSQIWLAFGSFKQNIFPTPPKLDESLLINEISDKPFKTTNLDDQPLDRLVPGYRSVSHLLPLEQNDFNLTYTEDVYEDGFFDNDTYILINKPSNIDSKDQSNNIKKRVQRNVDTPFYTVGVGTVFDADRYFEVSCVFWHKNMFRGKEHQLYITNSLHNNKLILYLWLQSNSKK